MEASLKAKLLLGQNKVLPVVAIYCDTEQVTLQEQKNVFNTVDFRYVEFIEDESNPRQRDVVCSSHR